MHTPTREILAAKLPGTLGIMEMIEPQQDVSDIITEVLTAHKLYLKTYVKLAPYFAVYPEKQLFDFCQKNLPYQIESSAMQTSRSPQQILQTAETLGVDCKHYANFTGGVLSALASLGMAIPFAYRFASYKKTGDLNHVFIVTNPGTNKETWIDPTPIQTAGGMQPRFFNDRLIIPVRFIDKKPTSMPLYRMAGITGTAYKIDEPGQCLGSTQPVAYTPGTAPAGNTLQDLAYSNPEVQAYVQAANSIISNLPDGGLKNFLNSFLSNPTQALKNLVLGRTYTSGAYNAGEHFLRNVLGQTQITNRGQVPDEVVPPALQFWTLAIGVPIGSSDHYNELLKSGQAYRAWANGAFSFVPQAMADAAHNRLLAANFANIFSQPNTLLDTKKFALVPYIYPLYDVAAGSKADPSAVFTGTHPITNEQIINGYPAKPVTTTAPGGPGAATQAGQSNPWLVLGLAGAAVALLAFAGKPKRTQA